MLVLLLDFFAFVILVSLSIFFNPRRFFLRCMQVWSGSIVLIEVGTSFNVVNVYVSCSYVVAT